MSSTDEFYDKYHNNVICKNLKEPNGHAFSRDLQGLFELLRMELSARYRYRTKRFLRAICKEPPGTLLDIGCGVGKKMFTTNKYVVGIDICLDALQDATRVYDKVILYDGTRLPFPENSFDYVVLCEVMGHVPEERKDELLREVFRVLKAGGMLVATVETLGALRQYVRQHAPDVFENKLVNKYGHIGMEPATHLLSRLTRNGFTVTKIRRNWAWIWDTNQILIDFKDVDSGRLPLIGSYISFCRLLNSNAFLRLFKETIDLTVIGGLDWLITSLASADSANQTLITARRLPQ
ncbi:MAG: class I SAM-dependent methyltransferase [Syntrophobacteraceae bacterium]